MHGALRPARRYRGQTSQTPVRAAADGGGGRRGFIETPYRSVEEGRIDLDNSRILYYSAEEVMHIFRITSQKLRISGNSSLGMSEDIYFRNNLHKFSFGVSYNFFDILFLGDGEEVDLEVIELFRNSARSSRPRARISA